MLTDYSVFDNLFGSPNISPARFLKFCMFVLETMTNNNEDGKYDDAIAKIQAVIDAVNKDINSVDAGLSTQVNSTYDVKQLITDFGQFMKNNSGTIAYALGGNTTSVYYEFYPYKSEEYLRANKKTMPMLAARVSNLATKYADVLGTQLSGDLQSFLPAYKKLLSTQSQQISGVTKNRTGRNDAFTQGQWTLTGIVHDVASLNNGDPQASKNLFPFAMLTPPRKSNIVTLTGTLAISENKQVLNRFLTEEVTVTVQNKVVNANMMVWLAANPKDDAPATAVVVNANTKSTLTASDLGDLKNEYLMIKNMSSTNVADYEIDIMGLKREPKKKAKPVTKEEKAAVKEEKPAAAKSDELHVAS